MFLLESRVSFLNSTKLPIMFNPVGLAMPIPGLLDKLPVPPGEEYKRIHPGETVLCEVEKLGRLENRIVEQMERQPNEP